MKIFSDHEDDEEGLLLFPKFIRGALFFGFLSASASFVLLVVFHAMKYAYLATRLSFE